MAYSAVAQNSHTLPVPPPPTCAVSSSQSPSAAASPRGDHERIQSVSQKSFLNRCCPTSKTVGRGIIVLISIGAIMTLINDLHLVIESRSGATAYNYSGPWKSLKLITVALSATAAVFWSIFTDYKQIKKEKQQKDEQLFQDIKKIQAFLLATEEYHIKAHGSDNVNLDELMKKSLTAYQTLPSECQIHIGDRAKWAALLIKDLPSNRSLQPRYKEIQRFGKILLRRNAVASIPTPSPQNGGATMANKGPLSGSLTGLEKLTLNPSFHSFISILPWISAVFAVGDNLSDAVVETSYNGVRPQTADLKLGLNSAALVLIGIWYYLYSKRKKAQKKSDTVESSKSMSRLLDIFLTGLLSINIERKLDTAAVPGGGGRDSIVEEKQPDQEESKSQESDWETFKCAYEQFELLFGTTFEYIPISDEVAISKTGELITIPPVNEGLTIEIIEDAHA